MTERQKLKARDIPSALFGKISGEIVLKGAGIEIVDRNKNLAIAQERLKKGPVIVVFNHFDDDFSIWGKFAKTLAPLKNVAVLTAMQYLDSERNKRISTILHAWEKGLGVELIPIVQTYDIANYPDNANSINLMSIRRTLEFLRTPGHVLIVSPEGTRSKDGTLSEAQEGIGAIIRNTPDAFVLPTAAIPSPIKLFKTTTQIFVGSPFTYDDLEREYAEQFGNENLSGKKKRHDKQTADLLMRHIASLLPEQNRGVYR